MKADRHYLLQAPVRVLLLCICIICVCPSNAFGNVIIPVPITFFGSYFTRHMVVWVLATMLLCVSLEGAIYHYAKILKRPYIVSLIANVVTLCAGIPLSFAAALIPISFFNLVLIPTALSIIFEYLLIITVLRKFILSGEDGKKKRVSLYVIGANILSNLIILGLILLAFDKTKIEMYLPGWML